MPLLRDAAQNDICQSIIDRITTGTTIPTPLLRVYDGAAMIAECAIGSFSTPVGGFSSAPVADDTGVSGNPEWYEIVCRANTVVLSGRIEEIPYVLISGTFHVIGGLRICAPTFQIHNDEMAFRTEGSVFEPIIEVVGNPEIIWTFEDGSISNSSAPAAVDYGYAGTRITKLKVTPWSSVVGINFGYNGGDAGTDYTPASYYHNDQRVSGILNLHLVKDSLVRLLACGSESAKAPMLFIDLTDFAVLEVAEFFYNDIKGYSLTGCTALKRICFEGCEIPVCDFYDCTILEDFRGALGTFNSIRASYHPNLRHLCVRTNANLVSLPNMNTVFPGIQELWAWECHLTDDVGFGANNTVLNDVRLFSNRFTQAAIDSMMVTIDSLNIDGYWFEVDYNLNNIGPSPTGVAAGNGMIADGWNIVAYDAPSAPTVATPTADPVAGTYSSAQSVQLLCGTDGATIHYTVDGTQPTTSSPAYSTEILVSVTTRIRAIAVLAGYTNSSEYDGTFTVDTSLATPIFTPNAGTYEGEQTVTITYDENSENVYYRIDGGSWLAYTASLVVAESQLVEAYSTATGYDDSAVGSAEYTIGSALTRIDFATDGDAVNMEVALGGACDVTWHWSDGTTSTSLTPTKAFGSSAMRSHFVTFSNPAVVTRFGRGSTVCLIYSVDATYSEFPNCAYLFFFQCGLVSMSIAGGVFNQLHLANVGMNERTPAAQLDEWLIDLDTNPTYALPPLEIYVQLGRTAASDNARASVINKGWAVNVP